MCDTNIAAHLDKTLIADTLIYKDIPQLVQLIYVNPKYPSNSCIRVNQDGVFEVFTQNKWTTTKSTKEIFRELLETCYRVWSSLIREDIELLYNRLIYHKKTTCIAELEVWLEDLWDIPSIDLYTSSCLLKKFTSITSNY
jgi:hypothetical protein